MDPDVQQVLAYYTYYLYQTSFTPQQAMAEALARFPGIPPARASQIRRDVRYYAQIGESVARGIEDYASLYPDRSIRDLLGGIAPPAATVAVRVVGTETLPDGKTRSFSHVVNATWDMSAGEIEALAKDYLSDLAGDSVPPNLAANNIEWTIRGPTIAPSPQEQ